MTVFKAKIKKIYLILLWKDDSMVGRYIIIVISIGFMYLN